MSNPQHPDHTTLIEGVLTHAGMIDVYGVDGQVMLTIPDGPTITLDTPEQARQLAVALIDATLAGH